MDFERQESADRLCGREAFCPSNARYISLFSFFSIELFVVHRAFVVINKKNSSLFSSIGFFSFLRLLMSIQTLTLPTLSVSQGGNLSTNRQTTAVRQQQSRTPTSADSNNNKKKKAAVVQTVVLVVLVAMAVIVLLLVIAAVFLAARNTRLHQAHLKTSFPHQPILWTDKDKQNFEKRCREDHRLSEGNIFVAISSYRDPELCLTLEDLFEKAHCKQRLWVGIVEQNDPSDEASCHFENFSSKHKSQCRIIHVNWKEAQGPCVARAKCETLWKNEPYFLLVDSHMRFEPGWDVELLHMLFKCRRPKRTVITMYPQVFLFIKIFTKKCLKYLF